uniref:Uncharacterized protein n=1 Tax=Cannabis sativa TaxID=3483 RepID=A0A803NIM7_CANSA
MVPTRSTSVERSTTTGQNDGGTPVIGTGDGTTHASQMPGGGLRTGSKTHPLRSPTTIGTGPVFLIDRMTLGLVILQRERDFPLTPKGEDNGFTSKLEVKKFEGPSGIQYEYLPRVDGEELNLSNQFNSLRTCDPAKDYFEGNSQYNVLDDRSRSALSQDNLAFVP